MRPCSWVNASRYRVTNMLQLELQVFFRKRAANNKALLRKVTCNVWGILCVFATLYASSADMWYVSFDVWYVSFDVCLIHCNWGEEIRCILCGVYRYSGWRHTAFRRRRFEECILKRLPHNPQNSNDVFSTLPQLWCTDSLQCICTGV